MPERIQILIVEDDPLDTELLVRALTRAGFDFDWQRVDTEEAYLEKLEPAPDLIFSDCNMPQFSGLHALKLLKERGLDIPFIILSGSIGEKTAAAVMEQGATDCLQKGHPTAALEKIVRHALERRGT
ncbi:MAG TPA: response regulator [Chthoniobacteraceae bacterium]|nr:response regulator [Chthoniobacteraceae bacterium]